METAGSGQWRRPSNLFANGICREVLCYEEVKAVKIRVSALYPLLGHVSQTPQTKILRRYKFPSWGNFQIECDSCKEYFWHYGNAVSHLLATVILRY